MLVKGSAGGGRTTTQCASRPRLDLRNQSAYGELLSAAVNFSQLLPAAINLSQLQRVNKVASAERSCDADDTHSVALECLRVEQNTDHLDVTKIARKV